VSGSKPDAAKFQAGLRLHHPYWMLAKRVWPSSWVCSMTLTEVSSQPSFSQPSVGAFSPQRLLVVRLRNGNVFFLPVPSWRMWRQQLSNSSAVSPDASADLGELLLLGLACLAPESIEQGFVRSPSKESYHDGLRLRRSDARRDTRRKGGRRFAHCSRSDSGSAASVVWRGLSSYR